MTHHARLSYLRNLASVVTSVSRMKRPHEHRNCCKAEKNRAFFLDERDMPLRWSTMEASEILDHWDATPEGASGPVAILRDDPRFQAMVDESNQYEDVHVACSIAMLGEYIVATMGLFIFYKGDSKSGKDESGEDEEYEVQLLGGAVKVVELSDTT